MRATDDTSSDRLQRYLAAAAEARDDEDAREALCRRLEEDIRSEARESQRQKREKQAAALERLQDDASRRSQAGSALSSASEASGVPCRSVPSTDVRRYIDSSKDKPLLSRMRSRKLAEAESLNIKVGVESPWQVDSRRGCGGVKRDASERAGSVYHEMLYREALVSQAERAEWISEAQKVTAAAQARALPFALVIARVDPQPAAPLACAARTARPSFQAFARRVPCAMRARRAPAQMAQCTFRPALDPHSRALVAEARANDPHGSSGRRLDERAGEVLAEQAQRRQMLATALRSADRADTDDGRAASAAVGGGGAQRNPPGSDGAARPAARLDSFVDGLAARQREQRGRMQRLRSNGAPPPASPGSRPAARTAPAKAHLPAPCRVYAYAPTPWGLPLRALVLGRRSAFGVATHRDIRAGRAWLPQFAQPAGSYTQPAQPARPAQAAESTQPARRPDAAQQAGPTQPAPPPQPRQPAPPLWHSEPTDSAWLASASRGVWQRRLCWAAAAAGSAQGGDRAHGVVVAIALRAGGGARGRCVLRTAHPQSLGTESVGDSAPPAVDRCLDPGTVRVASRRCGFPTVKVRGGGRRQGRRRGRRRQQWRRRWWRWWWQQRWRRWLRRQSARGCGPELCGAYECARVRATACA